MLNPVSDSALVYVASAGCKDEVLCTFCYRMGHKKFPIGYRSRQAGAAREWKPSAYGLVRHANGGTVRCACSSADVLRCGPETEHADRLALVEVNWQAMEQRVFGVRVAADAA